jgi:CRP/FNR family transcriptional regulator, anaerobic regulatory protein
MPLQHPEKNIGFLGQELTDEILAVSDIKEFAAGTELVKEGQYIKVVPLVISGLVKVFTRKEDKELLLYYIQPKESCIMSFTASIRQEKSKITAVTETDTTLVLIPAGTIPRLVNNFPSLNQLFYQQFDQRYTELIETIQTLLYDRLDKRLMDYLQDKAKLTGTNPVQIAHKEIAADLGTAREVISRLIKKLEHSHKLKQHHNSIQIL